jgi:hypothetical protein
MEVCYWALLFMPLVILLYLYSLQIKGDSQKKKKKLVRSLDGSVGIATGYGLDDKGVGVQILLPSPDLSRS